MRAFADTPCPVAARPSRMVIHEVPRTPNSKEYISYSSQFQKIWPFWQILSKFGSDLGTIAEYIPCIPEVFLCIPYRNIFLVQYFQQWSTPRLKATIKILHGAGLSAWTYYRFLTFEHVAWSYRRRNLSAPRSPSPGPSELATAPRRTASQLSPAAALRGSTGASQRKNNKKLQSSGKTSWTV